MRLLQFMLAIAGGFAIYGWYGYIFPDFIAGIIALAVFLAILGGIISGQFKFKLFLLGGAGIASWPGAAMLADYILHSRFGVAMTQAQLMSATAFFPVVVGAIGHSLAQNRDKARDLAAITGGAAVFVAAIRAIIEIDMYAAGLAMLSLAITTAVVRNLLLLPPEQRDYLNTLIVAAAIISTAPFLAYAAKHIF